MKINATPTENDISLRNFFHNMLVSLFQSKSPDATDEQIAEAEKRIQDLIEDVAGFWLEEVSRPLMVIEKLGKNQYVCWEVPSKEGYSSILERENLDEWILMYTDEVELKEMISRILRHPLLQQHTQLVEQTFKAYEHGSYALSILGLLATIDALLSYVSGMNSTGMMQRINSIIDKLRRKIPVTNQEINDAYLVCTTAITLKGLTINKKFEESDPDGINRHWLMHGRSHREISKTDCIKMMRLINGILLMHELAESKTDK